MSCPRACFPLFAFLYVASICVARWWPLAALQCLHVQQQDQCLHDACVAMAACALHACMLVVGLCALGRAKIALCPVHVLPLLSLVCLQVFADLRRGGAFSCVGEGVVWTLRSPLGWLAVEMTSPNVTNYKRTRAAAAACTGSVRCVAQRMCLPCAMLTCISALLVCVLMSS